MRQRIILPILLILVLGVGGWFYYTQMAAASNGQFQQSLPSSKAYQLLRLRIDPALGLIPEISGNRLIVSVRLQQMQLQNGHYHWQTSTVNADFELTLCA